MPSPAAPDPQAAIADPHGPGLVESVLSMLFWMIAGQCLMALLAVPFVWACVWGMIGRVAVHDVRFGFHLSMGSLLVILVFVVSVLADFLAFGFSSENLALWLENGGEGLLLTGQRRIVELLETAEEDAAVGHLGVLERLPGRREHVGEEEEPVVGGAVRHLHRQEVRERHAEVLRLAAGDLAVELAVAEEAGAGAVLVVLGGLALAVELLVAHPARAAGDVERDDDPVPGPGV